MYLFTISIIGAVRLNKSLQSDWIDIFGQVLFLWVTKSQKQFEWLTEILHQVEEQDTRGIIRNHIFITQFKNSFDLRTVFLVSYFQLQTEKSFRNPNQIKSKSDYIYPAPIDLKLNRQCPFGFK